MIELTKEYVLAVLLAILPILNEFAEKLPAPLALPLTTNSVAGFYCDYRPGQVGGRVVLTNGATFVIHNGYVAHYRATNNYYVLQEPNLIRTYIAPQRTTPEAAVALAKAAIQRLGYDPTGEILAHIEPTIIEGPKYGTNGVVPRYRIDWRRATEDEPLLSIQVEVNGTDRTIPYLDVVGQDFWKPHPKLSVEAKIKEVPNVSKGLPPTKPFHADFTSALLRVVLPDLNEFARRFPGAPQGPLTTNSIARWLISNSAWDTNLYKPYIKITLTNRWCLEYSAGFFWIMAKPGGYLIPADDYLDADPGYEGPLRFTEEELRTKAWEAIDQLDYPFTAGPHRQDHLLLRVPPGKRTQKECWVFANWFERPPAEAEKEFQKNSDWDEGSFLQRANIQIEMNGNTGELIAVVVKHPSLVKDPPKPDLPMY